MVRSSTGCASRAGFGRPIGWATHSPSARKPASTRSGSLCEVSAPDAARTRTVTSRRSPGASGANGQATSTLPRPSMVTVSRPSLSSAEACSQPASDDSTVQLSRGVGVATNAVSSRSSARSVATREGSVTHRLLRRSSLETIQHRSPRYRPITRPVNDSVVSDDRKRPSISARSTRSPPAAVYPRWKRSLVQDEAGAAGLDRVEVQHEFVPVEGGASTPAEGRR